MANKSIADLRKQIAGLEARLEGEKRQIKDAMHTARRSLRPKLSSRTGLVGAFLTAAVIGVIGGWRLMSARRAARAR